MRPDLGPGTECVRECPRWKKVFKGKKVTVGHLLSCAFGRKVNVLCLQLFCKSDFFFCLENTWKLLGEEVSGAASGKAVRRGEPRSLDWRGARGTQVDT